MAHQAQDLDVRENVLRKRVQPNRGVSARVIPDDPQPKPFIHKIIAQIFAPRALMCSQALRLKRHDRTKLPALP